MTCWYVATQLNGVSLLRGSKKTEFTNRSLWLILEPNKNKVVMRVFPQSSFSGAHCPRNSDDIYVINLTRNQFLGYMLINVSVSLNPLQLSFLLSFQSFLLIFISAIFMVDHVGWNGCEVRLLFNLTTSFVRVKCVNFGQKKIFLIIAVKGEYDIEWV